MMAQVEDVFGVITSVLFFTLPFLLMAIVPLLRRKQSLLRGVYLSLLVLLLGAITLIVMSCVSKFNNFTPNTMLAPFVAFVLVPTLACVGTSRIEVLWRYRITQVITIIAIPVIYVVVWIACVNIGMFLGVLAP
jgi:hypothetical protein